MSISTLDSSEPNLLDSLRFVDVDDALSPRCPRTGLSITEHDALEDRHWAHRHENGRREIAKLRRGRCDLTQAQNRLLFDDTLDAGWRLEMVANHKLTKRQRAQVKLLKRTGHSVISTRTHRTKEQGRRRTRSQRAHNRVPKFQPTARNVLDLPDRTFTYRLGDTIVHVFDGIIFTPAA